MREFTTPQQAILAAEDATVTWLFEITQSGSDPIKASTKEYGDYAPLITQFDGITLLRNAAENGYIAKNYTSFTLADPESDYASDSFADERVTITLVITGVEFCAWAFDIEYVTASYRSVRFVCQDILRKWLDGVYPNTAIISDIADDVDKSVDPDYCVPVTYGDAYIPLRCVFITDQRYYVIKEPVPDEVVEIVEVSSPDAWPSKTTWLADAYSMEQSEHVIDGTTYLCFQPIIFDSDYDGDADSCGIFPVSGGGSGSILTRYQVADEPDDFRKPLYIIYLTLQDFGVDSDDLDIDDDSSDWLESAGLWFNGGFYEPKPREALLADLLVQCCSRLEFTDKLTAKAKSFSVVQAIETSDVQAGSFSFSWLLQDKVESAFYTVVPTGRPQTRPIRYPVTTALTPEAKSDEVLDLWLVDDWALGEKIAKNYFIVKHNRYASISWLGTRSLLHIEPDDVVSIADPMYGGTFKAIIEETTIGHDLSIRFSASMYNMDLLNWVYYSNDNSELTGLPDEYWDSYIPPAVTGVRICGQDADETWYGKDLRLCWNDVTIDSESTGWDEPTNSLEFNMPAHKFQDYIIEIYETSSQAEDFDWYGAVQDAPKTYITTPNNYFIYTYENNCADVEDSDINGPCGDLTIRVWARSTTGLVSATPCVFRAINDIPNDPDFPDYCDWGSILTGAWVSWSRHQDADFSHYLIKTLVFQAEPELSEEAEEALWSVVKWSRVTANHYTRMTDYARIYSQDCWVGFRVKAVDLFGNSSDYTQIDVKVFAEGT